MTPAPEMTFSNNNQGGKPLYIINEENNIQNNQRILSAGGDTHLLPVISDSSGPSMLEGYRGTRLAKSKHAPVQKGKANSSFSHDIQLVIERRYQPMSQQSQRTSPTHALPLAVKFESLPGGAAAPSRYR